MVKIVTDNGSDIPEEVARTLDISIIPLYVRFGEKVYREGVDLDVDGFYRELTHSPHKPLTSTLSPGDFIQLYEKLAQESHEIISIHLSSRYSSTYNVARLAADYVKEKCQVSLFDSKSASMGLGLIVLAAARAAKDGANINEINKIINRSIAHTHLFGIITNLNYIMGGSRLFVPGLWVALAKLGMKFNAKLFGEVSEGKVHPIGVYLEETRAFSSLERKLAQHKIQDIALLSSTPPSWEQEFKRRMSTVIYSNKLYTARFGCMTGIQAGPHAMGVAFIEGDQRWMK